MTEERKDSPEDAAYRAKARAWLAENAKEYTRPLEDYEENELTRLTKEFIQKKHAAGYSAIALPKDVGGAGGTLRHAQIFAEEELRYSIPTHTGIVIGFHMAMAAISKHGTPEQYQKFGTLTHSGQAAWCQLFSEPAAGSDLAGVRTRAVKQGDKWIVNGQKVWSSWAHHADFGILVARTDPSVPKHKGLTFFVIDMKQPGVEVRPIRQITGHQDFNETFLTDAVVPDEYRIGKEGEGWACAMTVLATERNQASGEARREMPATAVRNLLRAARDARRENGSALASAAIRQRIADFYVEEQGLKNFGLRFQEQLMKGGPPPLNLPVMKLTSSTKLQLANALLMDLEESGGIVQDPNAPAHEEKWYEYLWASAMRIAGGADEVLRNQLSERALGMPSEIRTDKDVPFDKLPS